MTDDATYYWCQVPGYDAPCPACQEACADECLPWCPNYTLEQWERLDHPTIEPGESEVMGDE